MERFASLDVEAMLVTRLVNVRYLAGFTGTNGQLLVTPEGGVFFTDFRYDEQSRRQVPDLRREIYQQKFPSSFEAACRELGARRVGFEAAGLTFKAWRDLDAVEGVELVPLEDEVERLRWAKDAEEIGAIERAQTATDDAFERVVAKLAEGMTERELALELELARREAGADALAFDTIAAFGENAAEPHHRPTDRVLRRGDIVKLDFGALVDGYHSDMTRTLAFGDPGEELRGIYELVRRAQAAGTEAVRAGVRGAEADEAARRVIAEAGHGERFGHSLGHGVGLEIHEGPTLRKGSDEVLPEGAVVTVEPGVYLAGVGGIRIEDMVVVEADGARVMPRTPKELLVV